MERQINAYLASVTARTWDWRTAFPRTSADNHSPMKLNFRRVNSDQMYLELYAFGKATSLLRPLSYLWNTEWGLMCVLFLKFFGSFLYSLHSVFSCSVDCKMTCVFMFLFRFSELFLGKAFKIIILKNNVDQNDLQRNGHNKHARHTCAPHPLTRRDTHHLDSSFRYKSLRFSSCYRVQALTVFSFASKFKYTLIALSLKDCPFFLIDWKKILENTCWNCIYKNLSYWESFFKNQSSSSLEWLQNSQFLGYCF